MTQPPAAPPPPPPQPSTPPRLPRSPAPAAAAPATPASSASTNGLAVGALVLGILAVLIGLLGGWVPIAGLAASALAFILGLAAVGLGIAGRRLTAGRGMALAGIITGVVGVVAAIIWTVVQVVGVIGVFDEVVDGVAEGLGGAPGSSGEPFAPYDGEDAPAFAEIRAREFSADPLVISDVEVLSDSFDDFLVRADVEHTGDEAVHAVIEARILRGGQRAGNVREVETLEPGQRVEVHLTGASSHVRDFDDIEFDVRVRARQQTP